MPYRPGSDIAARYPDWRIIRRPLDGAYGFMVHSRKLIVIDAAATTAEWDCTVAHEIVHLDRGDRCTLGDSIIDIRREQVVCRTAARRMIDVERFAEMPIFGLHPSELAEELGVDLETLREWVRSLHGWELEVIKGRLQARGEGAA